MKITERDRPLNFKYKILETSKRSGVLMNVGGVFQRADVKNANGRVYPRGLWLEVLKQPEVVERIENRRMVGAFGHPADGQTDPAKISHVITKQELRSDGTIYGEAEILDTPMGRIAATMLEAGVGLGISSRGDGSVEKKGGSDEVQTDFRLETYDFVLKPSTPGAYPEMLESVTVEENEKLVANAIDGLVNGKGVPTDQRMGVLTECLKILSALDAQNSGDRVKTLSTKIVEELGSAKPKVLALIQANESVEPELKPVIKESTMSSQQAAPQMAPDTLAWHQDQVNRYVNQAVGVKNREIEGLKTTVINAQREHTETKRRLKAAESLIEDFTRKIQSLEESSRSPVENPELRRRYEAAKELLDEAIKHLPELGMSRRRIRTLENLLQASIDRVHEEDLSRAVEENLAKIDEQYHSTIRPILEKCKTAQDVSEAFKAFAVVGGAGQRTHEPLPRRKGPTNEGRRPAAAPSKNFQGILGTRLSRAV